MSERTQALDVVLNMATLYFHSAMMPGGPKCAANKPYQKALKLCQQMLEEAVAADGDDTAFEKLLEQLLKERALSKVPPKMGAVLEASIKHIPYTEIDAFDTAALAASQEYVGEALYLVPVPPLEHMAKEQAIQSSINGAHTVAALLPLARERGADWLIFRSHAPVIEGWETYP